MKRVMGTPSLLFILSFLSFFLLFLTSESRSVCFFEIRNDCLLADALFWEVETLSDRLSQLAEELLRFGFVRMSNSISLEDVVRRGNLERGDLNGIYHHMSFKFFRAGPENDIICPKDSKDEKSNLCFADHVVIYTQNMDADLSREVCRRLIIFFLPVVALFSSISFLFFVSGFSLE